MSNGIPTIKSHLGLWGEVVAVDALAKAIEMTQEKVYHEHVTNFLYSNPQSFKIQLIDAPMGLSDRDDLRFTVDELEDFEMMKAIYNKLKSEDNHIKLNQLIGYVSNQTDYLLQMKRQIQKNKK
jgi:spore coat polysaccharide biosynthesis protein SpsF